MKSRKRRAGRHNRAAILGAAVLLASAVYLCVLPDVRKIARENPKVTALMKSRGDSAAEIRWTPYGQIPESLRRAVITAEDASFWTHSGIDFSEIWNAIKDAVLGLRLPRGASTLTQQLAKNLYLSGSYNPLRKIKEYIIARRLERALPKRRIFELYANLIEWGPHVYGLRSASRHYFGKEPAALSEQESAFLAAVIPNPLTVFNPQFHPARVAARQRLILSRMHGRLPKGGRSD